MKFEIGQTYQIAQPTQEGMKPYRIHILAIVDDCQVVYKWYGKHKQWWHYEVEDAEILEMKTESAKRLLTKRVPDLAESCAWKCHGRSDEICNHCTQYQPPSG